MFNRFDVVAVFNVAANRVTPVRVVGIHCPGCYRVAAVAAQDLAFIPDLIDAADLEDGKTIGRPAPLNFWS